MADLMWIKSHVELLLQGEWDMCRVRQDEDGDFPFRSGSAMCWVSVLASEPPMVRVFAHAAFGVKSSLALLRELNDIEHRALSARVTFCEGAVVVSQTISPMGLTAPVLAQAMGSVAAMANDIGPLVAAMFGGSTPFPAETTAEEEVG